jgi:hypothetical protein
LLHDQPDFIVCAHPEQGDKEDEKGDCRREVKSLFPGSFVPLLRKGSYVEKSDRSVKRVGKPLHSEKLRDKEVVSRVVHEPVDEAGGEKEEEDAEDPVRGAILRPGPKKKEREENSLGGSNEEQDG